MKFDRQLRRATETSRVVSYGGKTVADGRHFESIWKTKDISKSTKVLLYQSMVQSIVLYNSETWTIKDQKRKLKTFEIAVLRKIMWNNKKRQKTE